MICINCSHSIIRTFSNGSFVEREIFCDLDGMRLVKNVSECSRMSGVVLVEVPTEVRLPEPEPPEYAKAEQMAIDAMLPPMETPVAEVKRKGKPRAKRK